MTEPTPYDAARARYSRQALARLTLSDHAVEAADSARDLVPTEHDRYSGPGGRASQALRLVELAERTLVSAVLYERERGSSWAEIAQYLGIGPEAAEERFAPAVAAWHAAFEVPYRLDETGLKRVPQLPTAAYDPDCACRHLDQWAFLQRLGDDAVSSGLAGVAED